jgi:hypothetical protein
MPVSPGVPALGLNGILFKLSAANLQLTTDQAFTKLFGGTSFFVTAIVARQRSGAASVACVGGIYDGAGKTGNIIAAAATNWVTLASGITVPVLTPLQTALLAATPLLSLTTGSTAPCTADFYILGIDVS